MNGKITTSNSLRATFRYCVWKDDAAIIGGTIAPLVQSGALPEAERLELVETTAAKFELSSALNGVVERNCYHVSLSLPVYEKLGDGEFSQLADEYLAGLILSSREPKLFEAEDKEIKERIDKFIQSELSSYQYAVIKHDDAEHSHIHIVASRVSLKTGKAIQRDWDRYRSQSLLRHSERVHGLEQNQNSWTIPLEQKFPSKSQKNLANLCAKQIKSELNQVLQSVKPGRKFDFKGNRYHLRTGENSINLHRVGRTRALLRLKRDGSYSGSGLKSEDVEAVKAAYQELAEVAKAQSKKQEEDVNRLTSIIRAIWKRERVNRPKLKNVTVGDYRIRVETEGQPELFKRDLKLLGWSEGRCESYELTSQDVDAIDRYNLLSQKQSEGRLKDQQDRANATSQVEQARKQDLAKAKAVKAQAQKDGR